MQHLFEDRPQGMHPATALSAIKVEEHADEVKGGINLEVKEDEQKLEASALEFSLGPATDFSLAVGFRFKKLEINLFNGRAKSLEFVASDAQNGLHGSLARKKPFDVHVHWLTQK